MFYFETFQIILNPSSIKKMKHTRQCQQFKTKRFCDARKVSVTQKMPKDKPRPPAMSNPLKSQDQQPGPDLPTGYVGLSIGPRGPRCLKRLYCI